MSNMPFPETTMEQIWAEPRRDLTEEEKKVPYSKYHYKQLATISDDNLAKLNAGPVDPYLLLPIEQRSKVLDPGYLPVETGWGLLHDGTGLACTKVFFPDCTPEMLNWWFTWHPLEGLRYDIWCPNCHTDIWMEEPDRNRDASKVSVKIRNWGAKHHPTEGFSFDDGEEIMIRFYSPEEYGLDPFRVALTTSECIQPIGCFCYKDKTSALFGGDYKLPDSYDGEDLVPFSTALHTARPVEGGCELRSRYWIGKTIVNGEAVTFKADGFDYARGAWTTCRHSLIEYTNLASILGEIYRDLEGKID